MKNLFVPQDLAKKLKEKRFNEPCLAIYNYSDKAFIAGNTPVFNHLTEDENIQTAPIYQQVIDWFNKNHNMYISVSKDRLYGWYATFEKYEQYYELGNDTDFYACFNKAIENAIKYI